MTQRQPRVTDPAWLAAIRAMPCTICRKTPSDAAHIRSASREHGKRLTGMAEKPSDCWTLPLCREHHDEQHRHGNEMAWWARYGIDPFAVAVKLYGNRHTNPRRRASKPRERKPRSDRVPIKQRNDLPKRGDVRFRSRP